MRTITVPDMAADRLSGLFFLLAGIAMGFLWIPAFVDDVAGGNIAPATLPRALSWLIAGCGAWLMLKPTGFRTVQAVQMGRAASFVVLLAGGVWLMLHFGFAIVSPALSLGLMLMCGERRPGWLFVGVVAVPAMIWICVRLLLDRVLI